MSVEDSISAFKGKLPVVSAVTAVLGGIAGAYKGFLVGGVGGAIVGVAAGALAGCMLPVLVVEAAGWAVVILICLALIAIPVFVIWLIYSLWGVGKP